MSFGSFMPFPETFSDDKIEFNTPWDFFMGYFFLDYVERGDASLYAMVNHFGVALRELHNVKFNGTSPQTGWKGAGDSIAVSPIYTSEYVDSSFPILFPANQYIDQSGNYVTSVVSESSRYFYGFGGQGINNPRQNHTIWFDCIGGSFNNPSDADILSMFGGGTIFFFGDYNYCKYMVAYKNVPDILSNPNRVETVAIFRHTDQSGKLVPTYFGKPINVFEDDNIEIQACITFGNDQKFYDGVQQFVEFLTTNSL